MFVFFFSCGCRAMLTISSALVAVVGAPLLFMFMCVCSMFVLASEREKNIDDYTATGATSDVKKSKKKPT